MRRIPARRGAIVVVASAGLAGLLGGCSGSGSGSAGQGSKSTPSPTSTVAATDRAAVAAVLAWRDGWNKSISGHSSVTYRKTFSGKCTLCADNAETLDRYFGEADHITGGHYTLRSLKVSLRKSNAIVVDGVLSMSSSKVLSGKTLVDRKKGFTERISWKVVLEDGRWLVANLGDTL
ncbi:MAG: hypothetical protein ACJ71T_01800 [Actinomycetales bacterium]